MSIYAVAATNANEPVTRKVHQHLARVSLWGVARPRPVPCGAQQSCLQQVFGVPPIPCEQVRGTQQCRGSAIDKCFEAGIYPHTCQNVTAPEWVDTFPGEFGQDRTEPAPAAYR
jgi:hypothetical protein